jgi:hypothetical protein
MPSAAKAENRNSHRRVPGCLKQERIRGSIAGSTLNPLMDYQLRIPNSSTHNFMICILSSTRWLHALLPLNDRHMGTLLTTESLNKFPGAGRSAHSTSDRALRPWAPRSGGANPLIVL